MRRLLPLLAAAVAAALLLPAAAPAQDELRSFRSPSGNIGCVYTDPASGRPFIRCDILEIDNTPPAKPASCEFDWGHAFGVSTRGRGRRLCASDTVADPNAKVLPYGKSRRFGTFRCTSRRSSFRCAARSGHGFKLSRKSQKLF
jgi:hypothetical protein